MKYHLKYSNESINDIVKVYNGVLEASKDKNIANKYIDDLLKSISSKKDFPYSTPIIECFGIKTAIHHFTFKAYKVFYYVENDEIQILRILLAKSDFMKELM